MITQRLRGVTLSVIFCQAGAAFLLFWIWNAIFFPFAQIAPYETSAYVFSSLLLSGGFLVEAMRSDFSRRNFLQADVQTKVRWAFRQIITAIFILFCYQVATKQVGVSRLFLSTYLGVLCVQTVLINLYLPAKLAALLFHPRRQHNTLVVGPSNSLLGLRDWFIRHETLGLKIVGILSDEQAAVHFRGTPRLGGVDDLDRVLEENQFENVVISGITLTTRRVLELTNLCEGNGARLLLHNDLPQQLNRNLQFSLEEGHAFITFRPEPLDCPFNRLVKRGLDLAVALPVVALVLPLAAALVWLVQRLQSPGPVFFRQNRSGLAGQHFTIYKFRTMHVDHDDETRQASMDDGRIFRLGKILRKLSIDELPQFLNVLVGDMSVVGPRPHLHEHDELFETYAQSYPVRRFVKPGITGLAQVRGFRGETRTTRDLERRLEADLHYVENWSLKTDLLLILRTAAQVFYPPKSAY